MALTKESTMNIALIGVGIMGHGMGLQLGASKDFELIVWNRTRPKAAALEDHGASVAETAADACAEADIAITMLADADATHAVMLGEDGALDALRPDAIWLQMGTIGVEATERCARAAAARGISFVDAPVLGTKKPAETGDLIVLAGGEDALLDRCTSVFEAVGSRTIRAGDVGDATRLKLVANHWVLGVLGVLADTFALAEHQGLDPSKFLDAIGGGALDMGYAHIKGEMMRERAFPTSFPIHLATKDARLIEKAAELVGLDLRVIKAVLSQLQEAEDAGFGQQDMAALFAPMAEKS